MLGASARRNPIARGQSLEDETGVTGWHPTYPDMVTVDGSAAFRAESVDITPFAGSTPQQVFTYYNETDVPSKVTVAANTITLTNGDRDEDYYVTYDFGAGYFTDFTHWVDINVTSLTDNFHCAFFAWTLANADDDLMDIGQANGSYISIYVRRGLSNTHYILDLANCDSGTYTTLDTSPSIAVNTPVYLAISRSGTTLTCEIYSSAALRIAGGAGDVDTITGTVINTAFQYVYGLGSYNNGGVGKDISGTVSNLNLNAGAANSTPYKIIVRGVTDPTESLTGYLAEADIALALGSTLVSNGVDFTGGPPPTDWAESNATVTEVVGQLKVTNTAAFGYAQQTVIVEAGKLYEIVCFFQNYGQLSIDDTILGRLGTGNIVNFGGVPTTTLTRYAIAGTSTTWYLILWVNSVTIGISAQFDNISVKEVTHLGTDACLVVNAKNGNVRNWNDTGVDKNDPLGYTFDVIRAIT